MLKMSGNYRCHQLLNAERTDICNSQNTMSFFIDETYVMS